MAPVLDELAQDYAGQVKVAIINIDANRAVASQYGVTGVPALFFYKQGRLVDQAAGALPRPELERRLKVLLGQV